MTFEESQKWDLFWSSFRRGQMTNLVKQRGVYHRDLIETRAHSSKDESSALLLAKAALSTVHLVVYDSGSAATCLAPQVETAGDKLSVNDDALARCTTEPTLGGGAICSAIGNLFYRDAQYKEGRRRAKQAAAILAEVRGADRQEVFLARAENAMRMGRLVAQVEGVEEAARCLDELEHQLAEAYLEIGPGAVNRGRLDLLLALTLNQSALVRWRRGEMSRAKELVYRALYVLTYGEADDQHRLGYILFSASRLEASRMGERFPWAQHLADEALRRLGEHPLRFRTRVMRATCDIRAGRLDEAERELGNVARGKGGDLERELLMAGKLTAGDREIALAELNFARMLLLEHEADRCKVQAERADLWTKVFQLGTSLADEGTRLPKRFVAEGDLHAGLAVIRLHGEGLAGMSYVTSGGGRRTGRPHSIEDGRVLLQRAMDVAEQQGLHKILCACLLALTESYKGKAEATAYWQKSQEKLKLAGSTFLETWARCLQPAISGCVQFDFNRPFDVAERDFLRQYADYHVKKAGGIEAATKATRLARSTLHRYITGRRGPRKAPVL